MHIVDDISTPSFFLKINDDKIVAAAPCQNKQVGLCCGSCSNRHWQVKVSYLQHVIENAERYINNPALINWEWLHDAA